MNAAAGLPAGTGLTSCLVVGLLGTLTEGVRTKLTAEISRARARLLEIPHSVGGVVAEPAQVTNRAAECSVVVVGMGIDDWDAIHVLHAGTPMVVHVDEPVAALVDSSCAVAVASWLDKDLWAGVLRARGVFRLACHARALRLERSAIERGVNDWGFWGELGGVVRERRAQPATSRAPEPAGAAARRWRDAGDEPSHWFG